MYLNMFLQQQSENIRLCMNQERKLIKNIISILMQSNRATWRSNIYIIFDKFSFQHILHVFPIQNKWDRHGFTSNMFNVLRIFPMKFFWELNHLYLSNFHAYKMLSRIPLTNFIFFAYEICLLLSFSLYNFLEHDKIFCNENIVLFLR